MLNCMRQDRSGPGFGLGLQEGSFTRRRGGEGNGRSADFADLRRLKGEALGFGLWEGIFNHGCKCFAFTLEYTEYTEIGITFYNMISD